MSKKDDNNADASEYKYSLECYIAFLCSVEAYGNIRFNDGIANVLGVDSSTNVFDVCKSGIRESLLEIRRQVESITSLRPDHRQHMLDLIDDQIRLYDDNAIVKTTQELKEHVNQHARSQLETILYAISAGGESYQIPKILTGEVSEFQEAVDQIDDLTAFVEGSSLPGHIKNLIKSTTDALRVTIRFHCLFGADRILENQHNLIGQAFGAKRFNMAEADELVKEVLKTDTSIWNFLRKVIDDARRGEFLADHASEAIALITGGGPVGE